MVGWGGMSVESEGMWCGGECFEGYVEGLGEIEEWEDG